MSEIHIGNKKKLRRTIAKFQREGISHNLTADMKIPKHTGLTVIVDGKTAAV